MNAGEIGTEAGRLFEYNLPSSWIFRSQEDQNDFGIDGEIELKSEQGTAVGKESIFKVQIKGEGQSTFIKNGTVLSFKLKVVRLQYYFEFKIPVILFVVEVSSEKVFWLSITNDDDLRCKASESKGNEFIQVHIPVANVISRKNNQQASNVLEAVNNCWEYLNLKGLKDSVVRHSGLSLPQLSERISSVGDVLFHAYHHKLNSLLHEGDYTEVYRQAFELSLSPIVPAKDRFVAVLYYWQAFQIAPYVSITKEIYEENFKICFKLINLAREQKSRSNRLVAIGKIRSTKFKVQLDQLYATHHSVSNFDKGSLEYLIFNAQTQEMYRDCCLSLQKLIDLCNRLIKSDQFYVLSDLFIDIYSSVVLFSVVHEARGAAESIEFLHGWHKSVSLLTMSYFIIAKDFYRIERLYYMVLVSLRGDHSLICEYRQLVLSQSPDMEANLDGIEKSIGDAGGQVDFYSLTPSEQKFYFSDVAKKLGMDPDDPDNEYGRIVSNGLKNYDPTLIMKNCESLFVHYRGGGIIAQSLGMHSAGGMHLIVCLKYGYVQGTGYLLTQLYDDAGSSNLGFGFKQNYCNKCSNCEPRQADWEWSLKWYIEELPKYKELLEKYKF